MVLKVIEILKEQPEISQDGLGERLGLTRRVVQKYMNILKETGRNSRERCPLSNKIPLLRWAVTKVAVHLPYSFDLFGGRCHNQVRFLVFINEKTI